MIDSFMKSEEIVEFLRRTGLKELAHQFKNLHTEDFTVQCFGSIDKGVVVVTNQTGDILVTEFIHAESASRTRNFAMSKATEDELMSLIVFLKTVANTIIDTDSESRFRNWINICIGALKDALKEKL